MGLGLCGFSRRTAMLLSLPRFARLVRGAPAGGRRRLRVQRGLDDGPCFALGDAWDPTGPWRVLFQARQPPGQIRPRQSWTVGLEMSNARAMS